MLSETMNVSKAIKHYQHFDALYRPFMAKYYCLANISDDCIMMIMYDHAADEKHGNSIYEI